MFEVKDLTETSTRPRRLEVRTSSTVSNIRPDRTFFVPRCKIISQRDEVVTQGQSNLYFTPYGEFGVVYKIIILFF